MQTASRRYSVDHRVVWLQAVMLPITIVVCTLRMNKFQVQTNGQSTALHHRQTFYCSVASHARQKKCKASTAQHSTAQRSTAQRCPMLYYAIPCHTTLYHAIPCYTTLYYAILRYTMLYYAIPCCTMRYPALPYPTLPYPTIPPNTILYHTIPNYTILYYTIPHHTILYYKANTIETQKLCSAMAVSKQL